MEVVDVDPCDLLYNVIYKTQVVWTKVNIIFSSFEF